MVFSENLKWGPHYKLIVSRAYKILGLLRRVFYTISCVQSKRTLYLSLVKPHLLYCSSLWRPHLLSDIRGLETVQRRATKFIIGSNSLDYKERLLNLNILPLMMDFEIRDIIFFIKCVKTKYAHLNIHDFVTFSTSKPVLQHTSNFVIQNRPTSYKYKAMNISIVSLDYGILYRRSIWSYLFLH